jgi:L-lactate dehydrogenase (cytochrome)
MKPITCIEDLRDIARRKVPKAFFDYVDSGSYNEETLRANRADLETIKLRQRVMVDVSERSLATTIIGKTINAPIALAPICRHARRRRNLSAQAAEEANIPFTLSTMSINSIEQVADMTKNHLVSTLRHPRSASP